MREIITDTLKLMEASKPVKFVNDDGSLDKETCATIIKDLKEVLEANKNVFALSAPQIGIDARIICIKFNDIIKAFINPIITKKLKYSVQGETFASMPGKEILITRPEEISVVYYTEDLKYEDNKLLGLAARLFDQQAQLLDGVIPSELGLVSDIEQDGALSDLTEEEYKEALEIYKQFIKSKVATMEKTISEDGELSKEFRTLKFTEDVITGRTLVVKGDGDNLDRYKKAQAVAALSIKNTEQYAKQVNRAQIMKMANKSKKTKGKRRK